MSNPPSRINELNIAVFASGGGSNLEAILQATESGALPHVKISLVLSNKANAKALKRATSRAIPTSILSPNDFSGEAEYLDKLNAVLTDNGVNFIVLAGYLKKIPAALVSKYRGRMLNIHPSLLPAFGGPGMYGTKIHKAVLEKGVRWTGVTVHFVDEHYDTGPILLQKPVPVHGDDTPEVLAKRVLAVEHRLYSEALRLIVEGRVTIDGRRVIIDPLIPQLPTQVDD